MYAEGILLKDIANKFGVHADTVSRRFKYFNIPIISRNTKHQTGDKNNNWKTVDVDVIYDLFKNGYSLTKIANKVGVSDRTIKNRLIKLLGIDKYKDILCRKKNN